MRGKRLLFNYIYFLSKVKHLRLQYEAATVNSILKVYIVIINIE